MTRRALTGVAGVAGVLACTVVPFLFSDRSAGPAQLAAAAGCYIAVIAQTRSKLRWCALLPCERVVRRLIRIGIYLLPSISVGFPFMRVSLLAISVGICIAIALLIAETQEIRTGLSRRYLRLLPPIDPLGRCLNVLSYAFAGAAQEYLYRGLIISALHRWAIAAVAVATVAFVAEHLMQPGARHHWDTKDILTHTVLSIFFGMLISSWGSLPAAMIGHTAYNSPNVLLAFLRPSVRTAKGR